MNEVDSGCTYRNWAGGKKRLWVTTLAPSEPQNSWPMGVHPTQIDTNVVKTIIKQPIWEWFIPSIYGDLGDG